MYTNAAQCPPHTLCSWRESLYRVYKSSSQSMRVAVYGCKHDASTFETLLKEICQVTPLVGQAGGQGAGLRGRHVKGVGV